MQHLQDIDEVNMFRDDNTVVHLKRPQSKFGWHSIHFLSIAQFSVRENLLVVAGNAETKALQEMMPDILKQVGPKQYNFLKNTLSNLGDNKAAENDDDDDVPNLVGTFEDAGKKWSW